MFERIINVFFEKKEVKSVLTVKRERREETVGFTPIIKKNDKSIDLILRAMSKRFSA